jgi:hypothetical protein
MEDLDNIMRQRIATRISGAKRDRTSGHRPLGVNDSEPYETNKLSLDIARWFLRPHRFPNSVTGWQCIQVFSTLSRNFDFILPSEYAVLSLAVSYPSYLISGYSLATRAPLNGSIFWARCARA